jgi:hypothetical protein
MNYWAKFQADNGYYDNLDNATFEEAIKFLNRQVQVIPNYRTAIIVNKAINQEVYSLRTIR